MKSKHPKLEQSDQIIWSLEDKVSGGHGGGKSYTCSFCKKGFSNAQALGGHMNIHRKDKARLRESSEGNILSLDIVKTTTNNIHPPDHDDDRYQVSEIILESSDEEKFSSPERPCRLIPGASLRSKHGFEQLRQLPLFIDGSGGEGLRLIHHGSSTTTSRIELDLELRLGPDSRASSGSAK